MENNQNEAVKEENLEDSKETTYTQEQVDQIKKESQENFDQKFNKRWAREMSKREREDAKKNELIGLLKTQLGKDSIDELLDMSYEQYGVDRPVSTKDDEILGLNDANELLESDDIDEIEDEVNRLSSKKRSIRENAKYVKLENHLKQVKSEAKRKQEILDSGLDETVLEDEEFKKFSQNFKEDTSIKFIYETYSKANGTKKEKPFSPGSLRGTNKDNKNEVKEYYTPEEARKFTRDDFNRSPELYEAVQRSMLQWKK